MIFILLIETLGIEKSETEVITIGSVAEWSKALDLGSSLSGGVGSNPTAIKFSNFFSKIIQKVDQKCRDFSSCYKCLSIDYKETCTHTQPYSFEGREDPGKF